MGKEGEAERERERKTRWDCMRNSGTEQAITFFLSSWKEHSVLCESHEERGGSSRFFKKLLLIVVPCE